MLITSEAALIITGITPEIQITLRLPEHLIHPMREEDDAPDCRTAGASAFRRVVGRVEFMRKICVVIGSRANYGSIKSAMRAIEVHPDLELQWRYQ